MNLSHSAGCFLLDKRSLKQKKFTYAVLITGLNFSHLDHTDFITPFITRLALWIYLSTPTPEPSSYSLEPQFQDVGQRKIKKIR